MRQGDIAVIIPAKAGIHELCQARIPAFAGMTELAAAGSHHMKHHTVISAKAEIHELRRAWIPALPGMTEAVA